MHVRRRGFGTLRQAPHLIGYHGEPTPGFACGVTIGVGSFKTRRFESDSRALVALVSLATTHRNLGFKRRTLQLCRDLHLSRGGYRDRLRCLSHGPAAQSDPFDRCDGLVDG
jgi:hypothetical protein